MSMKPEFLCCIGAELKDEIAGSLKSSRIFLYRAAENQTIADMLADGFFNDADDLRVNDLILLYCPEQTRSNTFARVSSISGGVVKTTKLVVDPKDLEDIYIQLDGKVNKDGTSIMTGPLLMRATDDFKCAIAPYWDGIGFFKLNDNNSVTLMASLEYNSGFEPASNNTYNIGTSSHKWKNLYLAGKAFVSVINNGYDIAVPVTNSADTLALKSQVDDAANSGEQLYSTGVWYAKMYAATVVPTGAEYDGRNYADFSQVDSENNPVIKIYTGASGAWTLTETITPPANHNGYMTITSKIWDIAEQSGQQGGLVLWSWNNKTFTPYPRIVSFDSISVTGTSTVTMPASSGDSQIANKKYVDDAVAGAHYHPDLFDFKWADHILNDVQWLRADTFSWQDGGVYEAAYDHLVDDIDGKSLTSETIAGTTVQFYLADDGHKICPASEETNVASIYTATGVAWYYILDTDNQRFKLPRINPDLLKASTTAPVVTNNQQPIFTDGNQNGSLRQGMKNLSGNTHYMYADGVSVAEWSSTALKFGSESGLQVDLSGATGYFAGAKYLYFYVGSFTQTAIENTAGLNAELFNGKVDVGHQVIAFQAPTADNNYTWYRLYADGWVEQGGFVNYSTSPLTINLPIAMADTNYTALGTESNDSGGCWAQITNKTTTTVSIGRFYASGSAGSGGAGKDLNWQVSGMAAS